MEGNTQLQVCGTHRNKLRRRDSKWQVAGVIRRDGRLVPAK